MRAFAMIVMTVVLMGCGEEEADSPPLVEDNPLSVEQASNAPQFALVADGTGVRLLVSFQIGASPEAVVLSVGNAAESVRCAVSSGVAVFQLASTPDSVSVVVIERDGNEHTHEWIP
jgi:hypothetical protein